MNLQFIGAGLLSAPTNSSALSQSVLWFLLSVYLLDLFDISLPRGDAIDISGAICAAAIPILGSGPALLISITAALVAHLSRRGLREVPRLLNLSLARTAAVLSMTVFLSWVHSWAGASTNTVILVVGPAVFLLVDLAVAQIVSSLVTGRSVGRLLRGNITGQAPLLLAEWSASLLLLITFGRMGNWALIPVVALLLLMRQSYAMLLDQREVYRATVEVLVEAAESQDVRRIGHSERTAAIARSIAVQLGLRVAEVERISYASLLHDVDALSGPSDRTVNEPVAPSGGSSTMLEGVEFFEEVLGVLRLCDGESSAAQNPRPEDTRAAMIVALASDVDAGEHIGVFDAHGGNSVDRVGDVVPQSTKASVVGAALSLGYRTPVVR